MENTIKELLPQKIDKHSFKKFGQFIDNTTSLNPTIKAENVTFWKQQICTNMGGEYEIGLLKVKKQKMIFDELENHYKSPTGIICLDGDFILPLATPSDKIPKVKDVVAFNVSKGQLVMLDAKCWHGICYPKNKEEITILIFMAKDTLDNDTENLKIGENFNISLGF